MFLYKLRPDVQIEKKDHGWYLFSIISERFIYWKTFDPGNLMKSLQSQWLNEDDMAGLFSQSSEYPDWPNFFYFFDKLIAAGFLTARFSQNEGSVFSIDPALKKSIYHASLIKPMTRYRLSRFALLRQDNGEMVLECPLSLFRFIIHKKELLELIYQLCIGLVPKIMDPTYAMFLKALLATETVEATEDEQINQQDPMYFWEFHDLFFFSRTQKGRHLNPIGGTYRFSGKRKSPAVFKPIASNECVPLKIPNGFLSDKMARSFENVLSNRRSLRSTSIRCATGGRIITTPTRPRGAMWSSWPG